MRSMPWTARQRRAHFVEVVLAERTYLDAARVSREKTAPQVERRLLYLEAERGVKADRGGVEGVLLESHPGRIATPLEHSFHEPASETEALRVRRDGDRPDAARGVPLVEEVAAQGVAAALRDDAEHRRVLEQPAHEPDRVLERGEVTRDAVIVVERAEGLIDDSAARLCVGGRRLADADLGADGGCLRQPGTANGGRPRRAPRSAADRPTRGNGRPGSPRVARRA